MVYISLGGNCSITYQLIKYNLRTCAYPFDWCKLSLNQLINVLDNNFLDYSDTLKITNVSYTHKHNITNHPSLILSNKYKIKYAHEIINNDELFEFKLKMNKRIDRFINLQEKIKFIRIELEPIKNIFINKIKKLIKVLDKTYDYELILVINSKINLDELYNYKKIKIYKYDNFTNDWKMDNIPWSSIFNL